MLHEIYADWYCPMTYLGGVLLFVNVVWLRKEYKKVEWHYLTTYYVLPGVMVDLVLSHLLNL